MAADSDGSLTAVVICEGDLHDPEFPKKLKTLLGKLTQILAPKPKRRKKCIKVNKVFALREPYKTEYSLSLLLFDKIRLNHGTAFVLRCPYPRMLRPSCDNWRPRAVRHSGHWAFCLFSWKEIP